MQAALLQDQVTELLQWHCGTQLVAHADSLREISADFRNRPATYARLAAHQGQFVRHWRTLVSHVAPKVAVLLATATDEEVDEIFARFEKENAEFKTEYIDRPEAARRRAAAKTMRDRLEEWIDDLIPVQREAVIAWSEGLDLYSAERLRFRQAWQAELRRALSRRDNRDEFTARVRTLLGHPESYWNADYRRKNEHNRERTLRLFVAISATLEPNQYQHLSERANRRAADVEQLVCGPPRIQTTSVAAPVTVTQ